MQQRVGVPWKGWVLLFLLLFSDLPLIFLKPENYKFHLETFNFPPFLLYLSSLGILSLTVKCYYPVTSLISLNCVHSDGFKLSRELFIDCCFHCCCLNIWDVLYEVTSLSFKAHFWLLDTPRWRHCGLYNEFVSEFVLETDEETTIPTKVVGWPRILLGVLCALGSKSTKIWGNFFFYIAPQRILP